MKSQSPRFVPTKIEPLPPPLSATPKQPENNMIRALQKSPQTLFIGRKARSPSPTRNLKIFPELSAKISGGAETRPKRPQSPEYNSKFSIEKKAATTKYSEEVKIPTTENSGRSPPRTAPIQFASGNRKDMPLATDAQALKEFARLKKKMNKDLWHAAEIGDLKKIVNLLESGKQMTADINSKGIDSKTALHWAVDGNQIEAVKLLLNYKANIDARTTMKRSPLHISCIHGNAEISRVLIDAGASVDAQDYSQNTPVHYASEFSIKLN